jgi:hypothetical protein
MINTISGIFIGCRPIAVQKNNDMPFCLLPVYLRLTSKAGLDLASLQTTAVLPGLSSYSLILRGKVNVGRALLK